MFLKRNFWSWKLGCYKLVSEPWFEGFEHTLGGVWTQTEGLIDFYKENGFIKSKWKDFKKDEVCDSCD